MKKPRVITNCVANHYAAPHERIIEFNSENGGGLISFYAHSDGSLSVHVYRTDATVTVTHGRDDEYGIARPAPVGGQL